MPNTHKDHKRTYENIKVTKLAGSEAEIVGEIKAEEVEKCRTAAIKSLSEKAAIPGFRKGHIPESVIVSKLGEQVIMEEAGEIALSHEYAHIVIDNKLEVIGRPEITLTKVARHNPLGFKIKVALFPEVKMADYKKIAKAEMKVEEKNEVTEKEVDEAIENIRKYHAEQNAGADEHAGHEHAEGEHAGHDHAKDAKTAKKELPVFDEAFVKTLGDFKSIDDFKAKLKENLIADKQRKAQEKKRLKISEELVDGSKIELPEILVTSELRKMWGEFENDISRMGLKSEDYLKHIKKSREELEKDWRPDAEKRVRLQIIINRIATEEKIMVTEDEMQKEVAAITAQYKDADLERVRNYVEMVLTNEKVFRFLEGQKGEK
mgnify:CR=1 FL=1